MKEDKDYSGYLAKGSAIVFIALIVAALGGLGLRMFLARALSVEDYGLFYAVLAFFILLTGFRSLGLGDAMQKYIPEFRAKKKFDSLKSSIAISLLIRTIGALAVAVPLFIFSKQIAIGFFGTTAAVPVIRILCVWFVISTAVRHGRAVFTGLQDMVGFSITRGIEIPLTFAGLVVLSNFLNLESVHAALIYVLGAMATVAWILFRLKKHRSILKKGKVLITKPLAKKLLVYGLPLIFAATAGNIIARIDTLAITTFRTVGEVGLYEAAYPIRGFLTYFGVAIAIPLFPMLSELWAKNDEARLKSTLHFLTKFALIGMIPITLIVLAFPDVIIRILFGSDYVGAALALQILSIAAVAQALANFPGQGLKAAEQTVLYGKIVILSAITNLAADIILVPLFGIEGAAIATLLTFLLACFLRFYFVRRFIKFPIPLLSVGKAIIGGILTLLLVYGLKATIQLSLWPKLFAVLIPAGIFYLGWIFATRTVVREDLAMLNRAVPIPEKVRKILRKISRE